MTPYPDTEFPYGKFGLLQDVIDPFGQYTEYAKDPEKILAPNSDDF